jgi:hypothetical protein
VCNLLVPAAPVEGMAEEALQIHDVHQHRLSTLRSDVHQTLPRLALPRARPCSRKYGREEERVAREGHHTPDLSSNLCRGQRGRLAGASVGEDGRPSTWSPGHELELSSVAAKMAEGGW